MPSWLKTLALFLATATLYIATARLGLTLAMPPEKKATAVWPPSGIALALLLLYGYRVWPGIWLGAFLANWWDFFDPANKFSLGAHLGVSSAIAAGSTLQAVLGSDLLHIWIGRRITFDRLRHVFQFVGVAVLICLVASTVGVTTFVLAGFAPWARYGFDWWTWWLGDTMGIIVVTPLILCWSKPRRFVWDARRLAEAGLLLGLLMSVGLFVFGGMKFLGDHHERPLSFMTVPLVVWATFRFGHHGAMASLVLASGIAVWGTAHGHGPFVQTTLNASLLSLQSFMGVLSVTALALAGVLAERRKAEQAKAILIEQLELALKENHRLRGMISICAWCKKIRTATGVWEQIESYLHDHTGAEFSHGICPDCSEKGFDGHLTPGPR